MNKVAFEIERNKELFDKTLAELSTYDWENLLYLIDIILRTNPLSNLI